MKQRATIWAMVAAASLFLAGCEESAKQQVKARPPAKTPVPASARAQAPEFVREKLPFPDEAPAFVYLNGDSRPRIDVVLEKVQAKFDAGQKEYKAGNLQAARVDFDRAVDLILTSGFQVDSDPRLSEPVRPDRRNAAFLRADGAGRQRSGRGRKARRRPRRLMRSPTMTLPPGDPRLAAKAEKELISVPHDLPLTVNESVLQYLSFFTTRARARHRRAWPGARRTL